MQALDEARGGGRGLKLTLCVSLHGYPPARFGVVPAYFPIPSLRIILEPERTGVRLQPNNHRKGRLHEPPTSSEYA